ncbi:MAG: GTP-binding protein [Candidatus Heimdallarchaeota archaeon]|nr:GTP-binding protein [Candidatus Heimdallarchaeota archaeon]
MSRNKIMSTKSNEVVKVRYKTVLLGNGYVGKTSIKRAYFGMEFIDNYRMTLGAEVSIKKFNKYAMQIWDLGGQQGFKMILEDYFINAHSAVVIFDITNRESFNKVREWVDFFNVKSGRVVPMVLAGNKVDLRETVADEVTQEEAIALSQELSRNSIFEVPYIEVSAKTGLNIDYLFSYLLSVMETYRANE